MEVIKSFTGVWHSPVFGTLTKEVKETISIIHCNTLYIVMRITDMMEDGCSIPIETRYTRSYAEAIDLYNQWNVYLTYNMLTTQKSDFNGGWICGANLSKF